MTALAQGIQLTARLGDAPTNELHTDAFVEVSRLRTTYQILTLYVVKIVLHGYARRRSVVK